MTGMRPAEDLLIHVTHAMTELRLAGGPPVVGHDLEHQFQGVDHVRQVVEQHLQGRLGFIADHSESLDDLVQQLGGADVPTIGFAIGLERVLMVLDQKGETRLNHPAFRVFIATVTPAQIPEALALAESLRDEGVAATVNLEDRSLKRQLEQASKLVPEGDVLILGEDELAKGIVTVRHMSSGRQDSVPRSELVAHCLKRAAASPE